MVGGLGGDVRGAGGDVGSGGEFYIFFFAPTLNGYAQILRNNFLFDYKHESLLGIVLFVQMAGIITQLCGVNFATALRRRGGLARLVIFRKF